MHVEKDLLVLSGLLGTLSETPGVICVLVGSGRRGIKGACVERPFLLHPAAVIWHHLLLRGTEAYREGTPAPRHNPRRCMSAICPAGCRDQCSRERMNPVLGLRQRDTAMSGCTLADNSADTRPRVKPWPRRTKGSSWYQTSLRFDKSRATWHGAGDVAAGIDEEWRIRKLINVGKGVKHLPLGTQSRADVWINEAVFGSLWPAGQPAAVSSIWKCNEMSIARLNITPSVLSYQSWMERLWYDMTPWELQRIAPLTKK